MSTEAIVVQVSPEMATAYREASPEDRQKLGLLLDLRLGWFLKSGGSLEMETMSHEEITETIVVRVSFEVAKAYRDSSGWKRQRLNSSANSQLVEYFDSHCTLESAVEAISREAAAAGLTHELLDSITSNKRFDVGDDAPIPISLKIVALLFFLWGISSVIEIIVDLMHSRFNFNLAVFGLFIGGGLLRLSRGWRTCGLVLLWIVIVGIPVVIVLTLGLLAPHHMIATDIGQAKSTMPREIALAGVTIVYLLVLWSYHVLTRPDIRSLFGIPDSRP